MKKSGEIICELIPWGIPDQEKRKGRKSDNPQRIVFMLADRNNWSVAIDRESYPPVGKKFAATLADIMLGCREVTHLAMEEIVQKVSVALAEITSVDEIADSRYTMDDLYGGSLLVDTNSDILALIGKE